MVEKSVNQLKNLQKANTTLLRRVALLEAQNMRAHYESEKK